MKERFEPQIDPWELMIEHNQRIQKLEAQVRQMAKNSEELARAINNCFELQAVNRQTIDQILENQRQSAGLMADILLKSSPSAQGNH